MTRAYPQALSRALDEIDAYHDRKRREAKAELRKERRTRIELFKKYPVQFWGFINLFRPVPLSTIEAVAFYAGEVEYELGLLRSGDWKADEGRLIMCRERQVMARYFRRYSTRVWSREAA